MKMICTYFIVADQYDEEFRIKIGFSKDPHNRIKALQTVNSRKFKVMGWIKSDDQSLEKELHKKYRDSKILGEWFFIKPYDVLEELKLKSTSSFICVQSNVGEFLGCDKDAIPEFLGPWEWNDTEISDFCPQCGWSGGVHYNSAIDAENCLNCGYPIF
jgi:hypothetical protein